MSRSKQAIGEDDSFAALLMAAKESQELRRQLTAIVSLPSFHRKSLLNTFVQELCAKDAPPELIRAVGYLRDDAVAARLQEFLRRTPSERSL